MVGCRQGWGGRHRHCAGAGAPAEIAVPVVLSGRCALVAAVIMVPAGHRGHH